MRNKHEIFSLMRLSLALQTRFCSIQALRHEIEMISVRTEMQACTVTQEDLGMGLPLQCTEVSREGILWQE